MHKDVETWRFVVAHLAQGHPVMLLVVVASSGSSPGRQGFKMAVAADGTLCGSIGGGVMEVKLAELAKRRLHGQEGAAMLKEQVHRKSAPHHRSGMICSGQQTVLFFRLGAGHLKAARLALRCLQNGRPALLTLAQGADGPTCDVQATATLATPHRHFEAGGSYFRYQEALGHLHRLYLVGGGHCALALSELLAKLDFHLCLLDDRADLNTLHQNKFVHEKRLLQNYDEVGALIPEGPDVYVVVMTLGYRSDAQVLRQLMHKDLRYLGMLGSAAKVAALLEELALEGHPPQALARIRAPIGLPIHSQTPTEIAVSIAAELIFVRRDGGMG